MVKLTYVRHIIRGDIATMLATWAALHVQECTSGSQRAPSRAVLRVVELLPTKFSNHRLSDQQYGAEHPHEARQFLY